MSEAAGGDALRGVFERVWRSPGTALSYVTEDLPGVGGRLKERPEDFLVEEIPLDSSDGDGPFLCALVEKRGLTTQRVASELARAFGAPERDVRWAGRKDAAAVTRQRFTVRTPLDEPAQPLELIGLTLLGLERRSRGLSEGALAGNRFVVRLRGRPAGAEKAALRVLERLAETGAPNWFGAQRFGARATNHAVACASMRGQDDLALDALLGVGDMGGVDGLADATSRHAYARGDRDTALELRAHEATLERRVLAALCAGAEASAAMREMRGQERTLFLNAFQSAVFNVALEARIERGAFGDVAPGDVVRRASDGRCHRADDESIATIVEEVDRGVAQMTGPLWGPAMRRAGMETGAVEKAALDCTGVTVKQVGRFAGSRARGRGGRGGRGGSVGARRAVSVAVGAPRVWPGDDDAGSFLACSFTLPPGCYATAVMRELTKTPGS